MVSVHIRYHLLNIDRHTYAHRDTHKIAGVISVLANNFKYIREMATKSL